MKQYKAVAGPMNIQVDAGNTQAAFNSFSALINQNAQDGWEYHSMESITVTQANKAGCGQQPTTTSTVYHMLIFVKEI